MNREGAYRALTVDQGAMQTIPGRVKFFGPAADQAFKRAIMHHARPDQKHVLLDPFCGVGTALVYPAVMQRAKIAKVIGSDIDAAAVDVARWNLSLLGVSAVAARLQQIRHDPVSAKPNETEAGLQQLSEVMMKYGCTEAVAIQMLVHDMLQPLPEEEVPAESVSVVVTDPPYGQSTQFAGTSGGRDTLAASYMTSMANLRPSMEDGATATIITDFRDGLGEVLQSVPHFEYKELKRATGGAHGRNFRELHTLQAS